MTQENITPLTPSFPMEKEILKVQAYTKNIDGQEQLSSNSPSETRATHVLGGLGRVGLIDPLNYNAYNPHNARFYFNFSGVGSGRVGLHPANSGSELVCDDFLGCRVAIKKTQIEITNKINKDRIFMISGSLDDRLKQREEAVTQLYSEVCYVLKKFIEVYGGHSDFKLTRRWIPDNKIFHSDIIDAIPKGMTFRNDVCKKVYPFEQVIEYHSEDHASNFLRNAGLHDFAPLIAEELKKISDTIGSMVEVRQSTRSESEIYSPSVIDSRVLDFQITAFKFDRGFY